MSSEVKAVADSKIEKKTISPYAGPAAVQELNLTLRSETPLISGAVSSETIFLLGENGTVYSVFHEGELAGLKIELSKKITDLYEWKGDIYAKSPHKIYRWKSSELSSILSVGILGLTLQGETIEYTPKMGGKISLYDWDSRNITNSFFLPPDVRPVRCFETQKGGRSAGGKKSGKGRKFILEATGKESKEKSSLFLYFPEEGRVETLLSAKQWESLFNPGLSPPHKFVPRWGLDSEGTPYVYDHSRIFWVNLESGEGVKPVYTSPFLCSGALPPPSSLCLAQACFGGFIQGWQREEMVTLTRKKEFNYSSYFWL